MILILFYFTTELNEELTVKSVVLLELSSEIFILTRYTF